MHVNLPTRTAMPLLLGLALIGGFSGVAAAQNTPSTRPGAIDSGANPLPPSGPAATAAPRAGAGGKIAPTQSYAGAGAGAGGGNQSMTQMANQRIADLHAKLHITPQQQAQWDQFAQVMRDNAKNLDQVFQDRARHFQTMNAVENMQSYSDIEQMRAQDTAKLVQAFQALYDGLTPQQKHDADVLFRNQAETAQANGPR